MAFLAKHMNLSQNLTATDDWQFLYKTDVYYQSEAGSKKMATCSR